MDKRDKEKIKKRGCNIVQDVVLSNRGQEITERRNGGQDNDDDGDAESVQSKQNVRG